MAAMCSYIRWILMKRVLLTTGLALILLAFSMACSKQEEPTKALKPVAQTQAAADQKATAIKEAPARKEAEPKEHQATQETQKPDIAKAEEKSGPLNQAVLAYLAKTGVEPKYADPHRTARLDLNGDGLEDALVLLENPMYFCGTGGCTMLVFKGTKTGFEFVSRSSLIRGPVLVSETKTHGWRDLIVEVSGGGMAPKQVALKYTGSKYPLNPSTLPPLPKNQKVKGTSVF
jgi:hypothetical protein